MILTMVRVNDKINKTNKCTSVSCHFDGHANAWVQCCSYCLMQHVQGYPGSHWMLPSSNYLLCIAPMAPRATKNQTTTKKYTHVAAILMAVAVHRYNTACIAQ